MRHHLASNDSIEEIILLFENDRRRLVTKVFKTKIVSTKALEFCASEAVQVLGGAGPLRGHPVERIYRKVKVMAIGFGSEEIMHDLAVRQKGR